MFIKNLNELSINDVTSRVIKHCILVVKLSDMMFLSDHCNRAGYLDLANDLTKTELYAEIIYQFKEDDYLFIHILNNQITTWNKWNDTREFNTSIAYRIIL
jgi:hypothetical protein